MKPTHQRACVGRTGQGTYEAFGDGFRVSGAAYGDESRCEDEDCRKGTGINDCVEFVGAALFLDQRISI